MGGKWLLCMFLVLGATVVQAHVGHQDDIIDIEDDLDDVIEEVEDSISDTSMPPSPKVTYKAPVPTGEVYFADSFDRGTLSGWILSKAKKDDTDNEIAKYDGKWEVDEMKETKLPGDKGLVLMSRAKHHAISAKLNKPFLFDTKPLIVQYEVNFQNGIECGGAYVKLLSKTPANAMRPSPPDQREKQEKHAPPRGAKKVFIQANVWNSSGIVVCTQKNKDVSEKLTKT
nr:calnexin-like [Marmota flaviventris]